MAVVEIVVLATVEADRVLAAAHVRRLGGVRAARNSTQSAQPVAISVRYRSVRMARNRSTVAIVLVLSVVTMVLRRAVTVSRSVSSRLVRPLNSAVNARKKTEKSVKLLAKLCRSIPESQI